MNAKTSSSLSKAAEAILNGNGKQARRALQSELTDDNQTADAWLLQAWTSESFSDTEEALYRVLELDAENSLALNGLEWLSGIQEIAAGLDTAVDSDESEDSSEVVAEETEDVAAEATTEEEPVAEEEQAEEVVAEETEEAVAEDVSSEEETSSSTEDFDEQLKEIEALEAEAREEEEKLAEEAAQLEAEEAARLADEAAAAEEAEAAAEEKRRVEAQAELDRLNEEAEAERKAKAAAEAAEAQRIEDEKAAEAVAAAAAQAEETPAVEVAAEAAATVSAVSEAGESEVEEAIQEDIAELSHDVKETIAQAEEVVAAEEASQESAEERPLVLAVDDSPTIRKLLTMTLERQGFAVISAADGVEALTVLSEQLPDVILSDINMPRLNGYQLCKFVKKYDRTKHIPVIMLSGKDGVFDKMRGKMNGCNDYIVKPFESNDLVSKVREYAGITV